MPANKRREPLATAEAYKAALSLLEEAMPPRHRLMLAVHYGAPMRTVTARSLASAVGYSHYGTANLQYGTLSRKVCEILGLHLKYHVLVLAEFVMPEHGEGSELLWVMRPEVSRALEELKWV
jgi:hypothetical protein